jgi:outer membrane protein assembly factor BamB
VSHARLDGYSTTPVVVNGVVYVQDMESNVTAIKLATGKVLWTRNYSSCGSEL